MFANRSGLNEKHRGRAPLKRLFALAGLLALGITGCGSSTHSSSATTAATSGSTGSTGTSGASATFPGASLSQGVTANSVKVGITLEVFPKSSNLAPFSFRPDTEQATNAIIAYINSHGGVDGRQLVADYVNMEPAGLSTSPEEAACLKFTHDDHVFAVMAQYYMSSVYQCITSAHTFLIDQAGLAQEVNAAAYPYHISMSANYSQIAKDWVYGSQANGFFSPANGFKKLGLLEGSCESDIWHNPQYGIVHYLNSIGISGSQIVEYAADCTLAGLTTGQQPALLKFRQEGVTNVLVAAQPLDRNFTALAQQSGLHYKYSWMDFHYATLAANTQYLNQAQVQGSIAITEFDQTVTTPTDQKCNSIITAAGLPAFTNDQTDLLVQNECENLFLLQAAANAAGPTLTNGTFAKGLESLGTSVSPAVELKADYKAGKTTGGDEVQAVTWDSSCTCWKSTGWTHASYYSGG